jgi:hypothetical protein
VVLKPRFRSRFLIRNLGLSSIIVSFYAKGKIINTDEDFVN